jgi:hypothetical protein
MPRDEEYKILIKGTPPVTIRPGDSKTLGRSQSNDIRIENKKISRHHAIITYNANEGLMVEDLNSKDGIWYKGRKRKSFYLKPNSSFLIAGIKVTVGQEEEVDLQSRDTTNLKETIRKKEQDQSNSISDSDKGKKGPPSFTLRSHLSLFFATLPISLMRLTLFILAGLSTTFILSGCLLFLSHAIGGPWPLFFGLLLLGVAAATFPSVRKWLFEDNYLALLFSIGDLRKMKNFSRKGLLKRNLKKLDQFSSAFNLFREGPQGLSPIISVLFLNSQSTTRSLIPSIFMKSERLRSWYINKVANFIAASILARSSSETVEETGQKIKDNLLHLARQHRTIFIISKKLLHGEFFTFAGCLLSFLLMGFFSANDVNLVTVFNSLVASAIGVSIWLHPYNVYIATFQLDLVFRDTGPHGDWEKKLWALSAHYRKWEAFLQGKHTEKERGKDRSPAKESTSGSRGKVRGDSRSDGNEPASEDEIESSSIFNQDDSSAA